MNDMEETRITRGKILVRLLYTLVCLIIFEALKLIVQLTALFQFVYLLIAQRHSEPLRNFTNKVATYAYKIIRYATLNDNERPFPFNDFPAELDKPGENVTFD